MCCLSVVSLGFKTHVLRPWHVNKLWCIIWLQGNCFFMFQFHYGCSYSNCVPWMKAMHFCCILCVGRHERSSKCAVSRIRELNCLKNEQYKNHFQVVQLSFCVWQHRSYHHHEGDDRSACGGLGECVGVAPFGSKVDFSWMKLAVKIHHNKLELL